MCLRVFGIGKSSWYNYKKSTLKKQQTEEGEDPLRKQVIQIITDNPGYGYRRINVELKKLGVEINHKKLLVLLRKWEVQIKRTVKKKSPSGIDDILTQLGSKVRAIKRLSEVEFNTQGKVVFTDFTEIKYARGEAKLYLIPYLDHKTKVVTGYSVGYGPTAELALRAYEKAINTLKSWNVDVTQTYFHQDQGSAFKSYEYTGQIVVKTGAYISYSRVGTPGDNPEMESFFGRLKDEWKEVFYECETEEEIRTTIDRAILYYNTKRIHSAHIDKSPLEKCEELLKSKNELTIS